MTGQAGRIIAHNLCQVNMLVRLEYRSELWGTQDAAVRLGIFGADASAVRSFIEQGLTLIAVGIDTLFLSKAAGDVLSDLAQAPPSSPNY